MNQDKKDIREQAFPEMAKGKKKKHHDKEESEISLKWLFGVVVLAAILFASLTSGIKGAAIDPESLIPRHLRQKATPTPEPDRVPRGYSLSY